MTQQGLADMSVMSRRWVIDLEHGRVDPTLTELQRVGNSLNVPIGALLAESASPVSDSWRQLQQGGAVLLACGKLALTRTISQVNRRDFMRWAATIGVAALTDAEHFALAADSNLVDDLRQLNLDYGRRARTASPRTLVPVLRGHLSMTKALLDRASSSRHRELLSVVAEASALTGTLSFRADNRGDAGLYLTWALKMAREADNKTLQATVLTMLRGIYSTVPSGGLEGNTTMALAASDEACQLLDVNTPPIVRTYALVSLAEEFAVIGDEASCRRRLEEAETSFAQVDRASLDGYFFHWNSVRLAAWRGNCELLLNKERESVAILGYVHDQTPRDVIAFYTAATADLAAAHARLEEPERACELLNLALDVAAPASLLANGISRVVGVRERYLNAESPLVRHLDERLHTLAPRRGAAQLPDAGHLARPLKAKEERVGD
jgi:transcriptional regulator with XRE-family HTH domain